VVVGACVNASVVDVPHCRSEGGCSIDVHSVNILQEIGKSWIYIIDYNVAMTFILIIIIISLPHVLHSRTW